MNRTTRFAAIGLLCIGTSALSFGDIFTSLQPGDWGTTYNPSTALFSTAIQPGGFSLQSGLPAATIPSGTPFGNGDAVAFTLTYSQTLASGLATLTVGTDAPVSVVTSTVAEAGGSLDHLGIALSTGVSDEAIQISNIMLNFNGVNYTNSNLSSGEAPALLDVAMAPPTDLTGGFTLTGDISMSWDSLTDSNPQISAEIVGADSLTVSPEPGTWALLGSALVGLGFLRRKRIV